MTQRVASLTSTFAKAALGLALLLPVVANATCRRVGDTWMVGDCSPGGSLCERHKVHSYGYYGNDPALPLMTVGIYRRQGSHWHFVRYYSIRC